MKCKACKNEVPDISLYCMFCGERLVKAKAQKKKELKVPKPIRLESGGYFGRVMKNGERIPVYAPTEEEYNIKAAAIKYGVAEPDKKPSKLTLRQALRNYIDNNDSVLDPSTIRGYEIIYRNRFAKYMDKPISSINLQAMINDEAKRLAPKTVQNSWGLVTAALNAIEFKYPEINLPTVVESDEPFLDYEEIKLFVDTIKGRSVELAALLALHGLRLSELIDLDVSQIHDGFIHLKGATVTDKNNKLVHKETNKNPTSRRNVPVLMPRIYELLPESGKLITIRPNTILRGVNKACKDAGVTICGTHDLRRSFCSLAYHLRWNSQTTQQLGGWSNLDTVEKVYRKLAAKEKNEDVQKMIDFYAKC